MHTHAHTTLASYPLLVSIVLLSFWDIYYLSCYTLVVILMMIQSHPSINWWLRDIQSELVPVSNIEWEGGMGGHMVHVAQRIATNEYICIHADKISYSCFLTMVIDHIRCLQKCQILCCHGNTIIHWIDDHPHDDGTQPLGSSDQSFTTFIIPCTFS